MILVNNKSKNDEYNACVYRSLEDDDNLVGDNVTDLIYETII